MARRSFAFLIHPRTSIREDMGRAWRPLAAVPERAWESALRRLPLPPIDWGTIELPPGPDRPEGWLVLVPYSAQQLLTLDRAHTVAKIERGVDRAVELGADLVGLGALTAPVTKGGAKLTHRSDVGITNGNAFTAVMTFEAVRRLRERSAAADPVIAVVGASGSVGSCLVRMLAREGASQRLTLVARTQRRLERLADEVRTTAPGTRVTVATDIRAVASADVVVLLTASTRTLLSSEHLKPGAIVLDDTQPRNTSPRLLQERPDVLIVDGGLVSVPGLRLGGDIDTPPRTMYACLAETMLLAMDGHREHFSIGMPTLEQADHVAALARRYASYGFGLAPFHSFGTPLPEDAEPIPVGGYDAVA